MNLKNKYYWFNDALTNSQCNQIIELGLAEMQNLEKMNGPQATVATTFDHRQRGGEAATDNSYVRDTKISWLNQTWIYDLFHPYIQIANKMTGWNWDWDYSETAQFTQYNKGQFYGWHQDSDSDPYEQFDQTRHAYITNVQGEKISKENRYTMNPNYVGKIRKLSLTCNLSDPDSYDGGNLQFDFGCRSAVQYHTCTEIRPRGNIIVFPSELWHQVTPVTRGTRYSLVMWCLGRPFK